MPPPATTGKLVPVETGILRECAPVVEDGQFRESLVQSGQRGDEPMPRGIKQLLDMDGLS